MANWSMMPFDLLHDILMRFETFKDLVYFSVVCRSWNNIVTMIKNDFNEKATPWLLLAEYTENNPNCLRKNFNPITERCYQLELPEISRCRCWGTAYGWIVILTYDFELYLFNPITKARMSLPPLSCLPYKQTNGGLDEGDKDAYLYKISHFIKKAFVLKVDQDDFIVFITYMFSTKNLAFAKPGDRSWTSVHIPLTVTINTSCLVADDVIYRDAQILVLYEDASIGCLDVRDLSDPNKLMVGDCLPMYPGFVSDPHSLGIEVKEYVLPHPKILDKLFPGFALYLVDSGGDLFMIVQDRYYFRRKEEKESDVYETGEFFVYQLDFDTKRWFEVHDLGNVAIYVGNNSSMAIHAIKAVACNSNCIYYTDDESENLYRVPDGGVDLGVFSLEDRERYDIYVEVDKFSKFQTPLWFTPQI